MGIVHVNSNLPLSTPASVVPSPASDSFTGLSGDVASVAAPPPVAAATNGTEGFRATAAAAAPCLPSPSPLYA